MGGCQPRFVEKETSLNRGVKEFQRTKPIALAENFKKTFADIIKVPTVLGNLSDDGGVW